MVKYTEAHSVSSKKTKLKLPETRYEKILNDYPESDKADDAAYTLADIYEGAISEITKMTRFTMSNATALMRPPTSQLALKQHVFTINT